jgi:hypothetical protein
MRVIIRFSLNNDQGSALRNILFPVLENGGIMWTGANTGTYEGDDIDEADLRNVLALFWNTLAGYMGNAHLDHFWMYVDKKRGEDDNEDPGKEITFQTPEVTGKPVKE